MPADRERAPPPDAEFAPQSNSPLRSPIASTDDDNDEGPWGASSAASPPPCQSFPPLCSPLASSPDSETPAIPTAEYFFARSIPSPEEFLARYRAQARELMTNVYAATDRSLRITGKGWLSTKLCEDVIYLMNVQASAIEDYLVTYRASFAGENGGNGADGAAATTAGGGTAHDATSVPDDNDGAEPREEDIRAEALSSLLHALYTRQVAFRDSHYLVDLEGCCASANDFVRLAEGLEGWAEDLGCCRSGSGGEFVWLKKERELPDLIRLYVTDAEYAARLACRFAMDSDEMQTSGAMGLFGQRWEVDGSAGSAAADAKGATGGAALSALIGVMEEFLDDAEEYLCDGDLYRRATEAAVRGTAVLYLELILRRAERVRRKRNGEREAPKWKGENRGDKDRSGADDNRDENSCPSVPFADPSSAACRVADDIYALKSFFRSWVLEIPSVDRVIEREFVAAATMQKCLALAGDVTRIGVDGSADFVGALFKLFGGDAVAAKGLIEDLWGLSAPLGGGGSQALQVVLPSSVDEEIRRVAEVTRCDTQDEEALSCHVVTKRYHVPGLSVRDLLVRCYGRHEAPCEEHATIPHSRIVPMPSRREATKALKSEFLVARRKLGNVPLSKKKMKKKAKKFLETCREAGKLRQR